MSSNFAAVHAYLAAVAGANTAVAPPEPPPPLRSDAAASRLSPIPSMHDGKPLSGRDAETLCSKSSPTIGRA